MVLSLLLLLVLFSGAYCLFFGFPTRFYDLLGPLLLESSTKTLAFSSPGRDIEGQIKDELQNLFATFDKNGDGFISRQELMETLNVLKIPATRRDAEQLIAKADQDKDGTVSFSEFCSLVCEDKEKSKGKGEEEGGEALKEAFHVFDKNGDGFITVEELGLILRSLGLNEGKEVGKLEEMITKVDDDGDGMVNFDEFKKMMTKAGGVFPLL